MATQKMVDIDGAEAVSKVLLALLNTFPGLENGKKVQFSTLSETSGIGFYPTSGSALLSDKEDITGHVTQVCMYPFSIIYRAAPKTDLQKIRIKEFLDALGKWLELQPVVINEKTHKLTKYPVINIGNRVIKSISHTNPAHLNATYDDGVEDWIISATLKYENEYDK